MNETSDASEKDETIPEHVERGDDPESEDPSFADRVGDELEAEIREKIIGTLGEYAEAHTFEIRKSEEGVDESKCWRVEFSESESEDLEVEVWREDGSGEPSPTEKKMKVGVEVNESSDVEATQVELIFTVKAASAARPTKYKYRIDLVSARGLEGGEEEIYGGIDRDFEPHKQLPESVKEAWFGGGRGENNDSDRAVEYPIDVEEIENDGGDDGMYSYGGSYWITFGETETAVEIPKFKLERKGSGGSLSVHLEEEEWERAWKTVFFSHVLYWLVANLYSSNGNFRVDDGDSDFGSMLPDRDKYVPVRPVDLDPASLQDTLEDDGYYFPWQVIETACAALNSGKNVIFSGPPGCGKSTLAQHLAEKATGRKPLMATASPAWRVGDLMGRYLPRRGERGLEFKKGFFLRAIEPERGGKSKWLIIDEFNRAEIDACFGELFSVLAGDVVELPYEERRSEGEGQEAAESGEADRVRVIPAEADHEARDASADYTVPKKFRLIGTMNDADRAGLSNLSFALQRRLAIIPVRAPSNDDLRDEIVESEIDEVRDSLGLENYRWTVGGRRGEDEPAKLDSIKYELCELFAGPVSEGSCSGEFNRDFENLVAEGVVGVSVVIDVIRLVGEALRTSEGEIRAYWGDVKESDDDGGYEDAGLEEAAKNLVLSYLAMSLVSQVFPQLEGLATSAADESDELMDAVEHIFRSLHSGEDKAEPLLMLRVVRDDDDYKLESNEKLSEYLLRNFTSRFPEPKAGEIRERVEETLEEGER